MLFSRTLIRKLAQLIISLTAVCCVMPSVAIADKTAEINQELRWAASIDDAETITQLLAAGASVNAANKFGKTALMNAAENGNIVATSTLLSMGADVNIKTVWNAAPTWKHIPAPA